MPWPDSPPNFPSDDLSSGPDKTPEKPRRGLSVRVQDPEGIAQAAQAQLQNPDLSSGLHLSSNNLDGLLFSSDSTDLFSFLDNDKQGQFFVGGDIKIALMTQELSSRGFYSQDRVLRIKQLLAQQFGIEVEYEPRARGWKDILMEGQQLTINSPGKGVALDLVFGPVSELDAREQLLSNAETFRQTGKIEFAEAAKQRAIRPRLNAIEVILRDKNDPAAYYHIGADSMKEVLGEYARLYEATLKSLYAEAQVPEPDLEIVLAQPEPAAQTAAEKESREIRVEVQQPELIHLALVDQVKRLSSEDSVSSVGISDGWFDDNVISEESTRASVWIGKDTRPYYDIHSQISRSEAAWQSPTRGFLSQEAVMTMSGWIEYSTGCQLRYVSEAGSLNYGKGQGLIITDQSGLELTVYLGPRSEAEARQNLLSLAERHKKQGWDQEAALTRERAMSTQAPVAEAVMVYMRYPSPSSEGSLFYMKLDPDNPAPMTALLQRYAKLYQAVLESLYVGAGEPIPNKIVTLRPPIMNQDAVAELNSVSEESPGLRTPEQVIQPYSRLNEVIGQEEAVEAARRLVMSINKPESYTDMGATPPKGVLLYGPPGNGKTTLARAIAAEADAEFIPVKVPDIVSKWFGEAEQKLQEVFDRARKLTESGRKVILFFDEIESVAPTSDDEILGRLRAVLLQGIDGVIAIPGLTILAATNKPERVDPGVVRSGRVDRKIHVPDPETVAARQAILKQKVEQAKARAKDPDGVFAADLDLRAIAEVTSGMSGADLTNMVNLSIEDVIVARQEGKPGQLVDTLTMQARAEKVGAENKITQEIERERERLQRREVGGFMTGRGPNAHQPKA